MIATRYSVNLLAGAAMAALMAGAAHAEAAAEKDGAATGLEEIVITAQKRTQKANDVGITLNVFTKEQLKNYGVESAEDLEQLTPGLTVTSAQPSGVPVYTIRGVGFADFTTSSSSTVGLYFDEVNLPYSVMSRGVLFDIERVEVLKGPQGDLYGRNTTAGQINFISKKPTADTEAGISVDVAKFGVVDAEGYVSGAVSDRVRGRIAVKTIQSNEGWQHSISRPDDTLGKKNEIAVRGLLSVDLNDHANLLLNAHYFKDKSDNMAATAYDVLLGGQGDILLSDGNNRLADWSEGHRPSRDNDLYGLSAKLNWDVADGLTLTSVTAYDNFSRSEKHDTSGVAFEDANILYTTDLETFSQELRLSSSKNADFYWIVGGFYSNDVVKEDYYFNMEQSVFGIDVDTRYRQKTTSGAAFAHAEWQFADKLKLTLGARYTAERRTWTGCTYDAGDGGLAGLWNNILGPYLIVPSGLPAPSQLAAGGCGVYNDVPGTESYGDFAIFSRRVSTNRLMWKATLDYSPTDDVLIYGTVSNGFKSGGFNGAAAQMHSQLLPYKEETLTSYELGVKSAWLERRLQLNLSAFYYDYRNKQEPTVSVTPVGNIVGLTNVPKSEVKGAELEMHWLITKGLTLDSGVAYLKTKVKEYEAIDEVASAFPTVVTFNAAGLELPNAPRWQVNNTLKYEWAVSDSMDMFVAGDLSYKSSLAADLQLPIDGYTLVNARLGLKGGDGRWGVTLWGRNIFNDYYWQSASTSNCCIVKLNGMPATYGVTLSYNF